MQKRDLLSEVFEKQSLQKPDALTFFNYKIGNAVDKNKMIELLNNSVNKLKILCDDLKLELRLHEANPLLTLNAKQFYSTSEAAVILDISPEKIRQLINSGKLKAKIINQRTWKLPAWSVDAYKNDLCNFLLNYKDPIGEYDIIDVIGFENQLIFSFISGDAIHKVFEHQTRNFRVITNIILDL